MGKASRKKKKSISEGQADQTHGEPVVPTQAPRRSSKQSAVSGVAIVQVIRKLGSLLPAAVVIFAAMLALRPLGDADTWWHLSSGRWIFEHHAIPRTDTLSYTVPDHPWINLQWLFDLFIYSLYRIGGPNLLIVAAAVVFAAATALLLKNLRLSLGPVAASVLGLWVVAIAQGRFIIRPEMASLIFLPLVLWLYATGRRTGCRRLWLLPVVMLIWVNTHSLFVIGVFVIGCYIMVVLANRLRILPSSWRESIDPAVTRTILLSGILALCVTLANPYGLDGVLLPLKLMTRLSGEAEAFKHIGELRRSFSPDNVTFAVRAYKAFFFFSLAVVGLALFVFAVDRKTRAKDQGLDLAGVAIFAGLAYLSVLARRNMALFALMAAPFVGHCFFVILGRRVSATTWKLNTRSVFEAVTVAVLLPVFIWVGWFVASNNFYRWDDQVQQVGLGISKAVSPVKASTFVKEHKLPPPLYNDWGLGGYLTWDRPVPGGVYIDSRGEVYDDQFFSDYLSRLKQPDWWQDHADNMGFQTVIFNYWYSNHIPLVKWLLNDPRWALVYFDENATVFLRRQSNEALIEMAIRDFEPLREKQVRALLEPVSSWQWPAGRVRALLAYGNLLTIMGRGGEAVPFTERLLEIGAAPKVEGQMAVRLANHYMAIGETERASSYLQRAMQADPGNPDIAKLRNRIGW